MMRAVPEEEDLAEVFKGDPGLLEVVHEEGVEGEQDIARVARNVNVLCALRHLNKHSSGFLAKPP